MGGHPHNVGYTRYISSGHYGGYGGHFYGKREAEPYTIGQVAYGHGHGVVTGVDYGYGHVSGYGAIGNRGYFGGYGNHFYGKREADAEPEPYTIGHPHNVGYTRFISSGYTGLFWP